MIALLVSYWIIAGIALFWDMDDGGGLEVGQALCCLLFGGLVVPVILLKKALS